MAKLMHAPAEGPWTEKLSVHARWDREERAARASGSPMPPYPHHAFMAQLQAEEAALAKLDAASAALPVGAVVGGVLRFPVADGYATYLVVKERPLTVQHVPAGDAYAADPALIRGLNLADVRQRLARSRGGLFRRAPCLAPRAG